MKLYNKIERMGLRSYSIWPETSMAEGHLW